MAASMTLVSRAIVLEDTNQGFDALRSGLQS
jgi:hypothetical protein